MEGLVSVIIPTYNRWKNLVIAVESVKAQTYKNVEIIVVNDCSTQKEYYENTLEDVVVLNLPENLRKKHNVTAAQGMTRNHGLRIAKGEWIAFLDDDDAWLPKKLETQLKVLKEHDAKFSSTNAYKGNGLYLPSKKYVSRYFPDPPNLLKFYKKSDIQNVNLIMNSSVIIHKTVVTGVGEFELGDVEDWKYWLRALELIPHCIYITTPLIYYDMGHGSGKNYKYNC